MKILRKKLDCLSINIFLRLKFSILYNPLTSLLPVNVVLTFFSIFFKHKIINYRIYSSIYIVL